jgi:hypothetical protein
MLPDDHMNFLRPRPPNKIIHKRTLFPFRQIVLFLTRNDMSLSEKVRSNKFSNLPVGHSKKFVAEWVLTTT